MTPGVASLKLPMDAWLPQAFGLQLGTHDDSPIFIHVEKLHSGPPDLRDSDNLGPHICEMLLPQMFPWVVKFHDIAAKRRNRRDVWPFLGVAVGTSKGQVRQFISTTMLARADVLNMESEIGSGILRQAAVFTSTIGALRHEISYRDFHRPRSMCVENLPRFTLQKRDHVKHRPELLVFHLFFGRQYSFIRAIGKLIETDLNCWLRATPRFSAPLRA